jgi:hypothetical protein
LSPKKPCFSPSAEKQPLAGGLSQWAGLLALQACMRLTA